MLQYGLIYSKAAAQYHFKKKNSPPWGERLITQELFTAGAAVWTKDRLIETAASDLSDGVTYPLGSSIVVFPFSI